MTNGQTQRYAPVDRRQLWIALAWLGLWWALTLSVGVEVLRHSF